jgi:hypothetical protein
VDPSEAAIRIDPIDLLDGETVEVHPAHRGPTRWGAIAAAAAVVAVLGAVLAAPRASVCDVRSFAPGSGDGRSRQTPLLVHDAAALDAVRDCLDRHHLQVADILPNAPFVPLGFTSEASIALSGSYAGGGHHIVDLRIFLPGSDGVALFAAIDGGSVEDLVLLRPRVEGRSQVAALAGSISPTGSITGVRVIDAAIVAEDVAAVVAGTSSDDVMLDVEVRGGTVQVAGQVVGTLVGRVRADAATAGPSGGALATDTTIAAGVSLRDATGPITARAVGEVLAAG